LLERRGERREVALVLFKLALALHVSLRFAEANDTYQRAFAFWDPPDPTVGSATSTLRMATSFLPNDADPRSAIAWPNIQLCMQLFDRLVEQWPERTIVPGLAERWEVADDGLRYTFHLRDGLIWSDGSPLTAHDVEYGIKRVLNPDRPGSSVAIYFVLENGQDYYLRHNEDAERIGVRALDDRTVEFRLVSPAPYFLSVMNRPDGGPQPRHAIEVLGDDWTSVGTQVVSGAFEVADRGPDTLVLRRRGADARAGNVGRVELRLSDVSGSLDEYRLDGIDMIAVRYTPRLADLVPWEAPDASLGPAAWSGYLSFNHAHPATANVELRRALAYAVDRSALRDVVPVNMIVATGGVVPPALQGHTPEISLPFDPDRAREHLANAGDPGALTVGVMAFEEGLIDPVLATWRDVLGLQLSLRTWTMAEALTTVDAWAEASIVFTGWLPGYPDPEYYLRLLFQTDSKTNEGGFSYEPFDELIERARREPRGRERLELFHEADRMVVADRVGCIPLVYGRSLAIVKPRVHGWWEFGKSSASFADLVVDPS
jgi:oligopeptide transport system substrate-binding protein